MIRIINVPLSNLDDVWPNIRQYFVDAVEYSHGEMFIEDIYVKILSGEYAVYVVMDEDEIIASFTIEVRYFNRKKVVSIGFIGGTRMSEWSIQVVEIAETIALREKADAVYGGGRRGWFKAATANGYKEYHATFGKEMKGETL